MKYILKLHVLLLALLTSLPVHAVNLTEDISMNGFISQGYVYSPDLVYGGPETLDGTLNFREAALNLSWQKESNLRFTGQVMYRELADSDKAGLRLDFLFMDYAFHADSTANYGVRIGRFKNQLGLYNSSRDIPLARPGIEVPSAYFTSLRDVALSTDGIEFYGNKLFDSANLEFSFYLGQREINTNTLEKYTFTKNIIGALKQTKNHGLTLKLTPNGQHDLTFGFSLLKLSTELEDTQSLGQAQATISADIADNIYASDVDYTLAYLFAQYGYERWLWTAEYINLTADYTSHYGFFPNLVQTVHTSLPIEGLYLQAEYFLKDINLMVRYEKVDLLKLHTLNGDATGLTFGAKWMIDKNWTLAGEYSINEGNLLALDYEGYVADQTTRPHWNKVMLQLTYQF